MRAGGDKRGSNADRKRRKQWLLLTFGNGETCKCYYECGTDLDYSTVEADRIIPGGSYRRDNVVPACRPCNLARSDDGDLTPAEIAARVAKTYERTGRLTPALAG
jgi:5-methylcytosine-specific restriction endonuclease McrA